MEKCENTQARETTNDVIVRELTDENNSSTFVKEYLKAGFVSSAVDALFYASFRRCAEFALACGMVPLDITLVPIESARDFVIANPDLPLTQINYDTWLLTKETTFIPAPQNMQPTVIFAQTTITMPQTAKTSTQNIAEYGNQLPYSVGSGEQSTTKQYQGGLAA